jgi:hypothetical protein
MSEEIQRFVIPGRSIVSIAGAFQEEGKEPKQVLPQESS